MNECQICQKIFNEGNVCRSCRTKFRSLSKNSYYFFRCLECDYCDRYTFPCKYCAKYTFEFILGAGNGDSFSEEISSNSEEIYNLDELLRILNNKEDHNEDRVNDYENIINNEDCVNDYENNQKKKKTKSYYRRCNVQ